MEHDDQQIKGKCDDYAPSSARTSDILANPRKRPHSYDPTTQLETTIDEAILRQADKAKDLHPQKRMRVEEWPLKNSDDAAASERSSQLAHRKSASPSQKRISTSSTRRSRFFEGSMNDKISQRPPSLYTREEQAMERYASVNMEDVDMVYDAGIESNKPAGMFRFGKAIANAFSSVNVWQGLNGIWKEKERENQPNHERENLKLKAELKYAELKKNGFGGTHNALARPESQEVPSFKYEDTDESRRSSFRDSGVDVDGYQSSSDRKDSGQFTPSAEGLKPPPSLVAVHRSASPFSDASSGRRSSIRFHKPSLEGLKKVKSHIHLPSIKRSAEDVVPVLSTGMDDLPGPGLRREASKKDISKQYRLSKRVSDLENKLEVARRELELSIQQAPPVPDLPVSIGRPRFVPGALASLPSERLLTPQTGNKDVAAEESRGPAAKAVDEKAQQAHVEYSEQALWNKRASEIAARNAAARQSRASRADTETHDVSESEASRSSAPRKNSENPWKSKENKVPVKHEPSGVKKRPPKAYPKAPRSSPTTKKDKVPPVASNGPAFDPTNVDQRKIMAMRAIPDSHAPFGKAWDDMKNLRKEYTNATEAELVAYISNLNASKKVTDYTSVSHGDRPPSPFLGRPGSTSPMKTRARASRRGISPPPPSISSAKKFHRDLDAEKSPAPATQMSPEAGEEMDTFPTDAPLETDGRAPEATRASMDKPLPEVKDDFEWDEDVF